MAIARLTLIGMYNFNSTLFDGLTLPAGIDKQLFIDNLLLNYGECPLVYTNFNFLKFAIGTWGRKWYDSFERMLKTLQADYNPLHNFDRYENYEDNENTENELNTNGKSETETSGTVENTVSAFNVDEYQPDTKTDSDASGSVESESASNGKEDRKLTHDGHLYGNIGVTTSQQMLTAEIELRSDMNIYDICADIFRKEMCLLFY